MVSSKPNKKPAQAEVKSSAPAPNKTLKKEEPAKNQKKEEISDKYSDNEWDLEDKGLPLGDKTDKKSTLPPPSTGAVSISKDTRKPEEPKIDFFGVGVNDDKDGDDLQLEDLEKEFNQQMSGAYGDAGLNKKGL